MRPAARRLIGVLLATVLQVTLPSVATAKGVDLDRWIDAELLPYLREQITGHPRFKGETLMFVVLDDNAPAPVSNALALSLRDRLLDAALQSNGVRVGWRQGHADRPGADAFDCSLDDVHYYIGLELSRQIDGRYELSVRALDREDRSWVSGFGKSWRGELNRAERQAAQKTRVDESFLGAREVPFTPAQTDLLAAQLAHELSCSLMRQTNGEYVVPAVSAESGNTELDATVELISNNIAAPSAFEVTRNEALANAELAGKAHRIDGDLYQYWLSVRPNGKNSELTTLSASAYVLLPSGAEAAHSASNARRASPTPPAHDLPRAGLVPTALSINNAGRDALIGPLNVVDPANARQCGSHARMTRAGSQWSRSQHCSLLQTSAQADAVLFFLEHQPRLGLVRLGGDDCRLRTTAKVVRRGDSLRFPIAWFRSETGQMRNADTWQLAPHDDTYYAIAVADSRLARRLASHIDRLPVRCGDAARPGLTDRKLRDWLDELALLAAQSANDFGWRALQLKDVY